MFAANVKPSCYHIQAGDKDLLVKPRKGLGERDTSGTKGSLTSVAGKSGEPRRKLGDISNGKSAEVPVKKLLPAATSAPAPKTDHVLAPKVVSEYEYPVLIISHAASMMFVNIVLLLGNRATRGPTWLRGGGGASEIALKIRGPRRFTIC